MANEAIVVYTEQLKAIFAAEYTSHDAVDPGSTTDTLGRNLENLL